MLSLFIFLVEVDCENVFELILIVEYLLGAVANQEGAGGERPAHEVHTPLQAGRSEEILEESELHDQPLDSKFER